MNLRTLIAISTLAAGLAHAQTTTLDGPRTGVVHHSSSRSLRMILGVPGSSYLSDPVMESVDAAAIAPDGRRALAKVNGALYAAELGSGNGPRVLAEDAGRLGRIAWNASSTAAIAHDTLGDGLHFWRVESGLLEPSGWVDLSAVPGRLAGLVLDAGGRNAVAGFEADGGGAIYLLSPDAAPRLLARVGRPGGLALAANGRDLYAGDRERSEILEIRDFSGAADVLLFVGAANGIVDPVGLGLSADQRGLLVADASERTIAAYEISSRLRTARLDLDFTPTRFDLIAGKALFLLSPGGESEPIQVLDGTQSPAVYFIPVPTTNREEN